MQCSSLVQRMFIVIALTTCTAQQSLIFYERFDTLMVTSKNAKQESTSKNESQVIWQQHENWE
jgi:hypothetical protein